MGADLIVAVAVHERMLHVACCILLVASCILHRAWCRYLIVAVTVNEGMLHAACCMLHRACCMMHVACCR